MAEEKPIATCQSCPDCGHHGCLTVWPTNTYCHSCKEKKFLTDGKSSELYYKKDTLGTPKGREGSPMELENIKTFTSIDTPKVSYTKEYLGWRGVSPGIMKKYAAPTEIDPDGVPVRILFSFGPDSYQYRYLAEKKFNMYGNLKQRELFGERVFPPGSAETVTITEGALDAASAHQMLGPNYPCVGVSSASTAASECEQRFKYLNSFKKIYISLDDDVPGREATLEVARLFDPNKVYVLHLGELKDANAYLQEHKGQEYNRVWSNAKKHAPKGVISDYSDVEKALRSKTSEPIAHWPFDTLDHMTYGIRTGEVNLITAQEKVGKTEIMRAVEHHLLTTTDENIGIIHIEENERDTILGLCNYELNMPTHLPDSGLSVEDQLEAYKKFTKREGRLYIYSHFGSDDPNTILDIVRYLVAVCGCKFVFFDHITMVVTGFEGDDERKKLDYISTKLAQMTKDLDFTLFMVSHVNENNTTRGSKNISKVANLILHMERDIEADNYDKRNTITLRVKGNRFGGKTGPGGYLWFDDKTANLEEKSIHDEALSTPGVTPF